MALVLFRPGNRVAVAGSCCASSSHTISACPSRFHFLHLNTVRPSTDSIDVFRKADLRELKILQKIENKQYQDLLFKAQFNREQQERKFESEMTVSRRS